VYHDSVGENIRPTSRLNGKWGQKGSNIAKRIGKGILTMITDHAEAGWGRLLTDIGNEPVGQGEALGPRALRGGTLPASLSMGQEVSSQPRWTT